MSSSPSSSAELHPEDLGFGSLFSRIQEALVVADAQTGRISLWNPAAERVFGYTAQEVVGMSVEALMPADARARHRAGLSHFARTGHGRIIDRATPLQVQAVARDGTLLEVELTLSSVDAVGPGGERYVLALMRDVTRRLRASARLRRQAELLDLAPDAIYACTASDGRIVYWSRGAERLYGWSAAEACGSPAHVMLHTEFPEPETAIQAEVMRAGQWQGELVRTNRNGRRLVVDSHWALQPASGDEPTAFLVIDTDITDRRRAEEAQQRSSATLGAVVASSPVAVFAVDLYGNVQLWNPAAERMFGWSCDELLGRPAPHGSEGEPAEMASLLRRVQAEETITGLETTFQHRDGSSVEVSLSAAPLRDGGDNLHGMIVVLEDVTQRKRAADEHARLNQAELALRERDQVLATVSHDLKTPLTVIKGQAELLRRRLTQDQEVEPERLDRGLDLIGTAAVKMGNWIDQLLDTAHLQAGRPLALRRAPTDLVGLAWQAASESQRLTERHRLRVETDERKLIGPWDADRLSRVLDNLLGNAIKYSPEGGDICIGVRREGEQALMTVHDAGVGIPDEDQAHIFERFRRGANVVGRFDGSGIGLAGVSQIVRQHGGSISVHSQQGQGTTFSVRLPLTWPQSEAVA